MVYDRAKTVVVGYQDEGQRPLWHQALAQVAIELCAARSPEQKGAVENLVGFVKRRCFRAWRFAGLHTDLPAPLLQWLGQVNDEGPCRATGVIPGVRLAQEQARMKPLAIPAGDYGLRFPVRVGSTALVDSDGRRYVMPAQDCSLPATLCLYPGRVRLGTASGRHEAVRPRFPDQGRTSYLPGQRAEQLAAVAGARKRLYFMRQRLLELGPFGEACFIELIHA